MANRTARQNTKRSCRLVFYDSPLLIQSEGSFHSDLNGYDLVTRSLVTVIPCCFDLYLDHIGLSFLQALFLNGHSSGTLVDRDILISGCLYKSLRAACRGKAGNDLKDRQGLLLFLKFLVLDGSFLSRD